MSLIARLQTRFPSIVLNPVTVSANANRTPREVLLALIDNSQKYLADANYKVTVRGEARTPFVCYSVKQGVATLALSYSRSKLVLGVDAAGKDVKDIQIEAAELSAALTMLRDEAASGVYDVQLDKIKAERVSAQRAGLAVAGGAFDAQLAAINDQRMADLKKIIAAEKQAA